MAVLASLVLVSALPGVARARDVSMTVLHTTDVHGHLLPTYLYDGSEDQGGWLRCATLVESIRNEQRNVLLVDCGDTIQGGMESWLTRGGVALDVLEWLRYDAWVIGNHEFDWGLDTLKPLHDRARVPMLGANMAALPGRPHPLPKIKPFIVRDVDGVRVLLVGLTTPGIPRWTRPERLGDLQFMPSVSTLAELLPRIESEKPDVTILLVHQGHDDRGDNFSNEVGRLARQFQTFDLIIGGHSHQPVPSRQVQGVLYTQAGYHGNWLGRVDLVYDTVARSLTHKEARLIEIGSQTPMHNGMQAHFKDVLEKTRVHAAEILGQTTLPLTSTSPVPGSSSQQQLIARAIAAHTGSEIVLHGAFGNYAIQPGPVTREQLWRIIPYENQILTLELTAGDLKNILEENADHFGSYAFQGVYGLQYQLYPDAPPGRRVRDLKRSDGSSLHPRKRYSVAVNSYVAASGGNRYNRLREIVEQPESRKSWSGKETRDMVEAYLEANNPLDFTIEHAVQVHRDQE